MVVSRISDGLGNQMFQYACGYAVAQRLETDLLLDITILDNHPFRNFELNQFQIEYSKIISYKWLGWKSAIKAARILTEKKYQFFLETFKCEDAWKYDSSIMNVSTNTYLVGYWQSEKYFSPYRNDLLRIFTPSQNSEGCHQFIKRVSKSNSVSVHIRRGDYVQTGISISDTYYKEAFGRISKMVEHPVFYIFSDDMEYAKTLMPTCGDYNCVYVTYDSKNTTIDDMTIMARCKHNVIANSSFSWWGAWLNQNGEKIVIAPEVGNWKDDFYPESWIKIKL